MPSNYYELYFPILCQVILAAAVAAGLVGAACFLANVYGMPQKIRPMNPACSLSAQPGSGSVLSFF